MIAVDNGPAVYALTRQGAGTAARLAQGLPGAALFLPRRLAPEFPGAEPFDKLAPALAANFGRYGGDVPFFSTRGGFRGPAPPFPGKNNNPAVGVGLPGRRGWRSPPGRPPGGAHGPAPGGGPL